MIKLTLAGNTYGIRYEIKGMGFRWHPDAKVWYKMFNDSEKQDAEALANKWAGVTGKTEYIEGKVKEKRYPVKESYIFNLESMHDKIFCLSYDIEEGKISLPIKVAGKTINDISDLFDLLDEADTLRSKAWSSRGVTGKDYGRIKEIVAWRVEQRYTRCLASGMDEAEAGKCFEDM